MNKFVLTLSFILMILPVVHLQKSDDGFDSEWSNYKSNFNVHFNADNSNEETTDKTNFEKQLKIVLQNNKNWKSGQSTYQSTIYSWAHLSLADFLAKKTGLLLKT